MDHHQPGRRIVTPEIARAEQVFDQFCNATTLKSILGHFRHVCDLLKIKPNHFNDFYPKLKSKLDSWKAKALWKKFDQRASHKCYVKGKACPNTRVLIIGGGPCGLRSAIEAQLLGAKVVVVEKRDRMSRNNVLHLWPFVIQDLRNLGAKKFFGKFCAGSIDHISIRQLQCILLKVALILGVEFHENVSFDSLMPPPENQTEGRIGWRAAMTPADHPVSQYEFDILIGADGKRNTLEGFKRTEFRGRLAIAITVNFINKRTEAEARVEEISGVAFIFNQKFFKELYQETGIDLENIVYYKDDTHYFVMTAKKHSLIDKGVILQDYADTAKLLAKENVDMEALMLYARQAAEFSTNYQMLNMEFAVNHYGHPDVAMFDFTSMYAAENASRVLERYGHKLLMLLVGDSLLEPFWPTGSGCARGFLSSLDACWAIKGWSDSFSPLEVIAERESIYRLLAQTTPENLNKDCIAYTLDPHSRYPNLNTHSVTPLQVQSLLDTDDLESIKKPPVHATVDVPKKRRRKDAELLLEHTHRIKALKEELIVPKENKDTQIHPDTLLEWLKRQVALYDTVQIHDISTSFKSGLAICAIIHRYRPDLLDFHSLSPEDIVKNNQLAFDILEKEMGIPSVMSGSEMAECEVPDKLTMFSYLTQIYEAFRGEIPHIKHPKLVEAEVEPERPKFAKELSQLTPEQKAQFLGHFVKTDSAMRFRHSRSRTSDHLFMPSEKKNLRKRRSTEKMGATVEERQKRLEEIEKNRVERMRKRQYLRKMATQQFYKSMQMLQANAKREKDEPFEDYSIFLYRQTAPDFKDRVKDLEQKILYPDREPKMHAGHHRSGIDEEFSGRIKSMEDKLKGTTPSEKKPKDLLRAIGKIEKSDWNVKEIEKKIEENKMGRGVKHDRIERVPKWSREQFLARQTKMEKKGRDMKEIDSKYAEFDSTLKNIDKKIKEGNALGHNKVSAMAEQFANKNQDAESNVQKSNSKASIAFPVRKVSDVCHFCDKTVYLMEKLSAEGKSFHRGCFRCEYCSISLRMGHHTFDREKNGGRFYCAQHFGLPGTMKMRIERKPSTNIPSTNKENIHLNVPNHVKPGEKSKEGVSGLDLLDRGQTPERIEFENLTGVLDAEEPRSQMDEDEWTDRNFGASAAEIGSSDDISDLSDSDDDNVVYEEAIDQPLTKEGTLELAKNWTLRYSQPYTATGQSDTGSNEYEDSSNEYTSEEEESATATEDEEDVRARELRKQEVWLKVPPRSSDTDSGSETEVASNDESSEESEENSATEISTDSEFEHDGTTPTQHEIPEITINDAFVRKTRGDYNEPKKVKVKSRVITTINGNSMPNKKQDPSGVKLQFSRLEMPGETDNKKPDTSTNNKQISGLQKLIPQRKGDYALNRTHSTEGMASKISLELKKRYLLGGTTRGNSVIKSGSTSNVNTRLQNLTDSISQHQKLLNPAPEPSPTMQAFLQGTSKLRTGNNQMSPLISNNLTSNSSMKAFPFDGFHLKLENKSDDLKQQLPDLIKETSILKSKTEPSMDRLRNLSVVNDRMESPKELIEDVAAVNSTELSKAQVGENDTCRPRSPLHETSIIVPQVDWTKQNKVKKEKNSSDDSEMDSDSLSSSSGDDLEGTANVQEQTPVNLLPPRLQIHSTDGDLLLDEQANKNKEIDEANTFEPDSIECILLSESDKKMKLLTENEVETLNNNLEQLELQDDAKKNISNCSSPTSAVSLISNKQDDSENDVTTAAYTETEISEWARDGGAIEADDLHDVDLNINSDYVTMRKNGLAQATPQQLEGKVSHSAQKSIDDVFRNNTSMLLANGEDIVYMDTDNESLLDSLQDIVVPPPMSKNRGYVQFVNMSATSPVKEEKLIAPIAKTEIENDLYSDDEFGGSDDVIKMSPVRMEDVKDRLNKSRDKKSEDLKRSINSPPMIVIDSANKDSQMEEDSLLIIEPTEDTTNSEVTTIMASPVNPERAIVEEQVDVESSKDTDNITPDYLEYVKRLQSRIAEFSNAKDSIDVRKSKRKNSKTLVQARTAEIIEEEIRTQEEGSINNFNSPATSRKLEEITKERCKQKNLIQDLLMDKLEAHKQKSAEKKAKRAARASSFTSNSSVSPLKPNKVNAEALTPTKFVPTSIISPSSSPVHTTFAEAKRALEANQDNLTTIQYSSSTPLCVFKTSLGEGKVEDFKTPVAPPRSKHEEAKRTAEKAKQDARERARLKSDEDLGLSPEDKLKELRLKVAKRQLSAEERRRMENELDSKTRHYSFNSGKANKLQTSKSTDNMKMIAKKMNFEVMATSAKSMDELSNVDDPVKTSGKKDKKKSKDPERRKSIIQAVSDFFKRKDSPTSPVANKDKLSMFRLTPKSKDKMKLTKSYSEESNLDKLAASKSDTRPKSICEGMLARSFLNEDAPPLPPPPLHYTIPIAHASEDSLSDEESKTAALSTSQINKTTEGSCNSIPSKVKTAKRITRQAQMKRLRMAQEIQRKLEETEVKQRELESRGVGVEKALRGEGECSDRDEADLLREWFDLMRERSELHRYEKELLVRAQEIQLEDRYERLQQELHDRLADEHEKTSADVKKEGEIITEMLEIVAKRDSLIALLEEERQRYQEEDRDLEVQMLSKGLRLTPVKSRVPKYSV